MSNDVDPVGRPVDYERSHSERLDQQARIVGPFTRDIGSGNGHVALIAADFVGPAGEVISSFGSRSAFRDTRRKLQCSC